VPNSFEGALLIRLLPRSRLPAKAVPPHMGNPQRSPMLCSPLVGACELNLPPSPIAVLIFEGQDERKQPHQRLPDVATVSIDPHPRVASAPVFQKGVPAAHQGLIEIGYPQFPRAPKWRLSLTALALAAPLHHVGPCDRCHDCAPRFCGPEDAVAALPFPRATGMGRISMAIRGVSL